MTSTETIQCPLCNDKVEKLLYRFHTEGEQKIISMIKTQNPTWAEVDGLCSRCIDYYLTEVILQKQILPGIGPHFPIRSLDEFVILPTPLRLDVDQDYTGKGITICFIDSGFYPHPDLIAFKNRIRTIVDIPNAKVLDQDVLQSAPVNSSAWHGTMTTVVCAGDGYLSHGLYKGIAPGAELVLLKVQDENGKISSQNIIKALEWVKRNHAKYNIRIINMSLASDETVSYKHSEVDSLVESLFDSGIVVVAAIGNSLDGEIRPPANSLNVITIGGLDDENQMSIQNRKLYHSAYGKTIDGLMKPELIAPSIWIAAPILPNSRQFIESGCLHQLLECKDEDLKSMIITCSDKIELELGDVNEMGPTEIRRLITDRLRQCKYISPYYMHVDGTSFAAPIVSSVIAQLLEVNPSLTPKEIREIILGSAKRIEGFRPERQGYGVIQPRRAVFNSLKKNAGVQKQSSPFINRDSQSIEFYIQNDCAGIISLAGSFNHWAQDVWLLKPGKNGIWKIAIPMLPAGRYSYKFFVDNKVWLEDVQNPFREPDGFSGFNSILTIEN